MLLYIHIHSQTNPVVTPTPKKPNTLRLSIMWLNPHKAQQHAYIHIHVHAPWSPRVIDNTSWCSASHKIWACQWDGSTWVYQPWVLYCSCSRGLLANHICSRSLWSVMIVLSSRKIVLFCELDCSAKMLKNQAVPYSKICVLGVRLCILKIMPAYSNF